MLTTSLLRSTAAHLAKLNKAGITTPLQLLEYFPRALNDMSKVLRHFAFVDVRTKNSVVATLDFFGTEKTKFGKQLLKAILRDEGENLCEAVWFGRQFWATQYHVGDQVLIFGKPTYKFGKLSFPSPEISHFSPEANLLAPVYSELDGISSDWFTGKITLLRKYIEEVYDILPEEIRRKNGFRTRRENIEAVHFPTNADDWNRARQELAYEELFGYQHAGLLRKAEGDTRSKGRAFSTPMQVEDLKSVLATLPFALTDHQKVALFAILKDMEKDVAMNRLLQGDVGTGKTIVAWLACWHLIQFSKAQCALMVPTSVLANQHFANAQKFFGALGISVALLTGELTKKEQDDIKKDIATGKINLVIGTHALIVDDVHFQALGLAIIDEQHRFGVDQRRILEHKNSAKNTRVADQTEESLKNSQENKSVVNLPLQSLLPRVPHVLYMTATPIPRTLTLTLYGDQDVSIIRQYPVGRKSIITKIFPDTGRLAAYRFIESQIQSGRQVYWISPLVEESDQLEYADVVRTTAMLREVFPDFTIGMVHGRMKPDEKSAAMEAFSAGKTQILSATSVIEVGVDNPNATVICIEGAERFGLSQLHQFRGRVGRGQHQSYCYLFPSKNAPNVRLEALESTNDGFELSEIDLELRGPGEVWGLRQSGVPDFKIADLRDVSLISQIREDIQEWMKQTPRS